MLLSFKIRNKCCNLSYLYFSFIVQKVQTLSLLPYTFAFLKEFQVNYVFITLLLVSCFLLGYTPFLQLVRTLFGNDVQTQDIKAVFRKIATNPDAEVDWGEVSLLQFYIDTFLSL